MKLIIEVSAGTTKRLLVLGSMAAIVLAGTVAYAEIQSFADQETLSAKKLNDNFGDLDARIKAGAAQVPTVSKNGRIYSLGATFVDTTAGTTGRISSAANTGYLASKDLCEQKTGSKSAHMCTSEEIVRSRQLDIGIPADGWYSGGLMGYHAGAAKQARDCGAWTQDAAGQALGPFWLVSGGGYPDYSFCADVRPILCCD